MISFHDLVYALGMLVIVVALYFLIVAILDTDYFRNRENRRVEKWNQEILKKKK